MSTANLEEVLCVDDFEPLAKEVLPPTAFAYYKTGADHERTIAMNRAAFQAVELLPRVLVDVSATTARTTILGSAVEHPIFISGAARGGLAHEDGEACIAKGAAATRTIQMVPLLGSETLEDVAAAADAATLAAAAAAAAAATPSTPSTPSTATTTLPPMAPLAPPIKTRIFGAPRWLQIYVHADREKTLKLIRRAEAAGYTALVVTVDAPTVGHRRRDIQAQIEKFNQKQKEKGGQGGQGAKFLGSAPRSGSSAWDTRLSWSDLTWFKNATSMKIILKGIVRGDDAVRAARSGLVAAIVVSNHGGRNLDSCRPTLAALAIVMQALREAKLQDAIEVYMDGGVRHGADVFKALALGAKAVGVGRPVLYALATHGEAGVTKCLDLLVNELVTTMMLMGTPTVAEVDETALDASRLHPPTAASVNSSESASKL
eukprot:gene3046-33440_t